MHARSMYGYADERHSFFEIFASVYAETTKMSAPMAAELASKPTNHRWLYSPMQLPRTPQ